MLTNENLVPSGHVFRVDDENPFLIAMDDVRRIAEIGDLVSKFLGALMTAVAPVGFSGENRHLAAGIGNVYQWVGLMHPERLPALTRVDLMVDADAVVAGWRIAEIDPANKHGLGFGLAARFQSGAGDRQKMLSLLAPLLTDDLVIVLGQREVFFRFEQQFFATKLAEHTGRKVRVLHEHQLGRLGDSSLILDFPVCKDGKAQGTLAQIFSESPARFVNPPRHWMANKSAVTVLWQRPEILLETGLMSQADLGRLRACVPWTQLASDSFVIKETQSSGAKGVHFFGGGAPQQFVMQDFVPQRPFPLGGESQYIRMAAYFVGKAIGELVVTASPTLPVHGGDHAVNYHVNVAPG